MNVVTNNYDAEQGFASGAAVSVKTKSGTNEYHGSLFEYLTNGRLRAHNFFDAPGSGKPKNIVYQYGATFGGPILPNKLFFFARYEGMRQRQNFSRYATVATEPNRTGDFSANGTSLYDPNTGAVSRREYPETSRRWAPVRLGPAAHEVAKPGGEESVQVGAVLRSKSPVESNPTYGPFQRTEPLAIGSARLSSLPLKRKMRPPKRTEGC